MAVRVMSVVSVVFAVFVPPAAFRNNNDGVSECINTEASTKASPLMLRVFKDEKTLISFTALLLMALVLIVSDAPRISLHFKDTSLLTTRFVVGFVLPLIVIDMIDSSREEENG